MFAADCPTKRAAFMTDIDPGRWIDVPAISYFDVSLWRRAKPRTLLTNFFGFDDFMYGCRNLQFILFLDFIFSQN